MIRCAILFLTALLACGQPEKPPEFSETLSADFKAQWFQGKAEVTRYKLSQARYGELRDGDAVLIFVTEDFRTDKQVKLENYTAQSKTLSVPVIKMNFNANFNTGIYAYTTVTSVFTPIDLKKFPHSLKMASTVQEWCGQVYTQLNLKNDEFVIKSFSYFENEGDENFSLPATWLEDELWARIRIGPENLPLGVIRIIPGAIQSRFLHRKLAVEEAETSIKELFDDRGHVGPILSYTIDYKSNNRKLILNFKKFFPHEITSFEGIYIDGFGARAKELHTLGVKTHSLMLDYWAHNSNADSTFRILLGLE